MEAAPQIAKPGNDRHRPTRRGGAEARPTAARDSGLQITAPRRSNRAVA
jgi:hypothetical protein